MSRDEFLISVTSQFDNSSIPYTIKDRSDITVSEKFKKENDDSDYILYLALFYLDITKNSVFWYEKAMYKDAVITDITNAGNVKVGEDEQNNDIFVPLSIIVTTVATVAKNLGYSFERVHEPSLASYPVGFNPDDVITKAPAQSVKYCTACGAKMPADARFCTLCGSDNMPVAPAYIPPVTQPYVQPQPQPYGQPLPPSQPYPYAMPVQKKKNKKWIWVILIIILIIAIVIGIIFAIKNMPGKKPVPSPSSPSVKTSIVPTPSETTAPVSGFNVEPWVGVDEKDLGNVANSSFYFETEDYAFYSSFDKTTNNTHIYRYSKEDAVTKTVFDGFGWAFVKKDDWLYFTGNEGDILDTSYTIYKMRTDGSGLTKLNDIYSHGLMIVDNQIYYLQGKDGYSDGYGGYSFFTGNILALDGSAVTEKFPISTGMFAYKGYIYQVDTSGNILRYDKDWKPEVVYGESGLKSVILGNEKIIALDPFNNIVTLNLDGSDYTVIRENPGHKIYKLNSAKDKIFFVAGDDEFDFDKYGYYYDVYSINFDGSDETVIYTACSVGLWINVVNNRMYVFEMNRSDLFTERMQAYVVSMKLDGSDIKELYR